MLLDCETDLYSKAILERSLNLADIKHECSVAKNTILDDAAILP